MEDKGEGSLKCLVLCGHKQEGEILWVRDETKGRWDRDCTRRER